MKIALINVYTRQEEYPCKYSLATMRLSEYLMSFGYKVDLIPISIEKFKEVDFEKIKNEHYDLIGLSNYSWVEDEIIYIDRMIRKFDKSTNIVVGGPQVDNIDLSKWEDEYFIVGEGEKSLLNLVRYIESGKKDDNFFNDNKNIFTKKKSNYQKVEIPIQVSNPLLTNIELQENKFLWYETCRGCAYSCGYCGHKTRKKVDYIDLSIIEQEIKNIGDKKIKSIFVIDPNFAGNKERAKKIIDMFNKDSPQSKLTLYLRPEFIDNESICLYKDANIDEIRIGIQTMNNNVPKWIRSNSLKHIENELPKLSANDINWRAELIVGLPGDNYEGLKNSIEFVESLKPTTYYCYHLTLIEGVKIYSLVDNFNEEYWITKDEFSRAYSSSSYSHDELIKMLKYSEAKSNNYNNKIKTLKNK